MSILPPLLFGISASLDALLVGMALGLQKIPLPARHNLLISTVTLIGTVISIGLGNLLLPLFPIGIGFSASITGLPFLPASVSTFFCSFGFLAFGSRLGRSAFLQQIGEYTDPVSGLLLILLGLCQLYH